MELTYEERRPLVEVYWRRADPEYQDSPDSESFAGFITRVEVVLEKLPRLNEGSIMVFTHGYVMKAVLWLQSQRASRLDRAGMKRFDQFRRAVVVSNCGVLRANVNVRCGSDDRRDPE
jgi:broad specificity phosphatase PhoE